MMPGDWIEMTAKEKKPLRCEDCGEIAELIQCEDCLDWLCPSCYGSELG